MRRSGLTDRDLFIILGIFALVAGALGHVWLTLIFLLLGIGLAL